MGVCYKVNRGDKVAFWKDIWLGETPLHTQFSDLYTLCADPEVLVEDCGGENHWDILFRRNLNPCEQVNLQKLYEKLQEIHLNESDDEVFWALDKSRNFTTRSLYRFTTFGGAFSKGAELIWGTNLPLKIKIFLWQVYHNKLQSAATLKNRG